MARQSDKNKKKVRGLNKKAGQPRKATSGGAPFNDQDVKRRLGHFEGAGEAPRRTMPRGSKKPNAGN